MMMLVINKIVKILLIFLFCSCITFEEEAGDEADKAAGPISINIPMSSTFSIKNESFKGAWANIKLKFTKVEWNFIFIEERAILFITTVIGFLGWSVISVNIGIEVFILLIRVLLIFKFKSEFDGILLFIQLNGLIMNFPVHFSIDISGNFALLDGQFPIARKIPYRTRIGLTHW